MKPVKVLANTGLPQPDGFSIRHFGHYPKPGAAAPWRAEAERRDLRDILALIPESEKPDILVVTSPEYLPIPWDIAAFPGPKVLLITDWNVCLRFLPDLCPLFDYCFTDWPGSVWLRRAGLDNIFHQPLFGHDPARFRNLNVTRNLDVSFCGNSNSALHAGRNGLARRLAQWGARTGRPVHLDQAFGDAYVDVLNRSRLVFNHSVRGEANMRLFEAMACGAVPLVEAGNEEVPLLFREGVHYFGYRPEDLETRVESLLANPDRIAAVSAAGQKEAAGHTKSKQMQVLLEKAAGGLPLQARARRPEPRSLKALAKMRVLGAGYTLQEALEEVRARCGECPGLELETYPGLLLTALLRNPGQGMDVARRKLMEYLASDGFPQVTSGFFRMQEAETRGDGPAARKWAEALLADLSRADTQARGEAGASPYAFFHAPVDLGQELNTELNRAFREDFPLGSHRCYGELLRNRALQALA